MYCSILISNRNHRPILGENAIEYSAATISKRISWGSSDEGFNLIKY